MQRVKGYRNVVTQGTYMGEEGTGYAFGELESYGDFSQATRGHIQGYTQPVEFEILYPGAQVLPSNSGELALFPPVGTAFLTEYGPLPVDQGITAVLAIHYKFIRLVG
jgi:hypothetical protein